jgi:hypothetical protein
VFEFRCNLYAKEGQLALMDARGDTAVMPCGLKVDIICAADYGPELSDFSGPSGVLSGWAIIQRLTASGQRAPLRLARLALSGEGKAGGMADNKTQPTKLSVAAFIDALTDLTRRADAKALVRLMQNAAGEKPKMWGPSIIGFGSYHYKYDSGREGDMPLIGFSPRKAATVLYIMAGLRDSGSLLAKLGKHTTGKGCLYINKLADVDQKVLEALVVKSVAAMRARSPI